MVNRAILYKEMTPFREARVQLSEKKSTAIPFKGKKRKEWKGLVEKKVRKKKKQKQERKKVL